MELNIIAEESASNQISTAERNLLSAILFRAVRDYLGNVKELKREAGKWIFCRECYDEEFSCRWVCEQIDVDYYRLVRELKCKSGELRGRIAA